MLTLYLVYNEKKILHRKMTHSQKKNSNLIHINDPQIVGAEYRNRQRHQADHIENAAFSQGNGKSV